MSIRRITVERRCDRGELAPVRRTDEGYLIVEGFVAKPGILTYIDPDGRKVRELVTAENLHRADSLETLKRKPVTLQHPRKDVDPRSVKQFRVGSLGETIDIDEEGKLKVSFTVERSDAIKAVEDGTQQLSPGYRVDIDLQSGVHEKFGAYDAIQVCRRYNHVAIVDRARGGPTIRMRADAGYSLHPSKLKPLEGPMKTFLAMLIAAGITREDSEPIAKACEGEAQSRVDAATKEANEDLKTSEGKLKVLEDAEKVRKDAEPDDAKVLATRLDWFDTRNVLVQLAGKHGIEGDDLKADNDKLRLTVARKIDADIPEDASPEFVQGVFSMLVKRDGKGRPGGSMYRRDGGHEEEEEEGGKGKPFGKSSTDSYFDNLEAEREKRLAVKE